MLGKAKDCFPINVEAASQHTSLELPYTDVSEQTASGFESMITSVLPSDPSCRKAVLVLDQLDVERICYEPGAAGSLLDAEACILQFPVRQQGDVSKALRNIFDAGLDRPGSMLVQSPFDSDSYEEASLAPQRFAHAKHMFFSTLCMHLGAKEVKVEQIDLRTRLGKISVDAEGKRLGVGGEMSIDTSEVDRFLAQMNLHDEFDGGPPDLEAAEGLLRRTRLLADPNMRTLLEMRRAGSNKLLTRRLTFCLSNESKSNLNVAGRLKVPTFVVLRGDYRRAIEEQQVYTLTVEVKF